MKKESVNIMKKFIEKYGIEKTKKKTSFFDDCYDYKIYLKNLKTNWYLKFENKTRKCKFYSLYTRFDNEDAFKELAKTFNVSAPGTVLPVSQEPTACCET